MQLQQRGFEIGLHNVGSGRNGWFAPAGAILDYLKEQRMTDESEGTAIDLGWVSFS